jgi:hypothetical protein
LGLGLPPVDSQVSISFKLAKLSVVAITLSSGLLQG